MNNKSSAGTLGRGEALLASGSIGRPGWASLRRSLALRGFIVSALANARAGSAEAEQLEHLRRRSWRGGDASMCDSNPPPPGASALAQDEQKLSEAAEGGASSDSSANAFEGVAAFLSAELEKHAPLLYAPRAAAACSCPIPTAPPPRPVVAAVAAPKAAARQMKRVSQPPLQPAARAERRTGGGVFGSARQEELKRKREGGGGGGSGRQQPNPNRRSEPLPQQRGGKGRGRGRDRGRDESGRGANPFRSGAGRRCAREEEEDAEMEERAAGLQSSRGVSRAFAAPRRAGQQPSGSGGGRGGRRRRRPGMDGAPEAERVATKAVFGGGRSGGRGGRSSSGGGGGRSSRSGGKNTEEEEEMPPELKGLDPELIEMIENEIVDSGTQVTWDDIAGLRFAKSCIYEAVIWPMLRPDIFAPGSLTAPIKGMLLFGPPGTGKTLIGKATAHSSSATFFSISASSLTSKWIGQGEKLVRTMFRVADYRAPAVIFIDEIDSLLSQRSSSENEASRRIKTEFLVQLDGIGGGGTVGAAAGDGEEAAATPKGSVLVVGATNRPQELDEAARRRFQKRLYIPLPDPGARRHLIEKLLTKNSSGHNLDDVALKDIVTSTAGYSGADVAGLCREAAMGPMRECMLEVQRRAAASSGTLESAAAMIDTKSVRPMQKDDFIKALRQVRASVAPSELEGYVKWNKEFGSFAAEGDLENAADKGGGGGAKAGANAGANAAMET